MLPKIPSTMKILPLFGIISLLTGLPHTAYAQTSITVDQLGGGSVQTYTVPTGFVRAQLVTKGADGGTGTGNAMSGTGATALSVFSVTGGDAFNSVIGAAGASNVNDGGGGGTGLCFNSTLIMASGGGADNTDTANGGAQNGGNDVNNGRDGYSTG